MNPGHWAGVPIVALALVTSMALLSTPRCARAVGPEQARKLLHVGIGLVTLAFPWLFTGAAPVLVLAALALGWFELLRQSAPLQRHFAPVLQRVARAGRGESCFVAGTALAFLIADGSALVFCLPMAVLTLADAAAALVGQDAARRRGAPPPCGKTLAGSTSFFGVAFVCAVAALSMAGWGVAPSLAMALLLASTTTLVEAAAGPGLDNLLIPVVGAALLRLAAPAFGGAP